MKERTSSSNNKLSGVGKRRTFALSLVIVASAVIVLVTTSFVAQALAVTEEEIELKNLVQARKDLNSGNATAAIDNILLILEWEFKDVHPALAKLLESRVGNMTAPSGNATSPSSNTTSQ
jgi:formate/nitrite transporter FocA (FNT family)